MWYHIRCGKQILFTDVSDGYFSQCPTCDEDVYRMETEYNTIPEGIEQSRLKGAKNERVSY